MRIASLIATGLVIAACSAPPPLGPQPMNATLGPAMTAQEVRGEIVGNTGTGKRTGTNSNFTMYVNPDGTLEVSSPQPIDKGTWRITDDGLFCTKLPATYALEETCQSVHKAGAAVQLHSAHSLEEMTFLPGKKI
jgi:hypothetical protein